MSYAPVGLLPLPNWIPISDVAAGGIVKDKKPYNLAPSEWSDGVNMRFIGDRVARRGSEFILTGLEVIDNPNFVSEILTNGGAYRIIGNRSKLYSVFGNTVVDVSRPGGYTLGTFDKWMGSVFNGIFIANSQVDHPQFWVPGAQAADVSNWPTGWLTKSIRPYKAFLIAVNMIKDGVQYPYMLNWSHPADPGTLPISWDVTDPALDAGEVTIGETPGQLVDTMPLGDINVIYKTDSLHGMQAVASTDIFRFYIISREIGLLTQSCMVSTRFGHVFMSAGDIAVFDGQQVRSILEGKLREWYQNNINLATGLRAFAVMNKPFNEVWFCFPELGEQYCTKAIVWNFVDNRTYVFDLPNLLTAANVTPHITSTIAWADELRSWEENIEAWLVETSEAIVPELIGAAGPGGIQTWATDTRLWSEANEAWGINSDVIQFDYDTIGSLMFHLTREGLAYVGTGQNGPIADLDFIKSFNLLRIRGVGSCDVYIGYSDDPEQVTTWQGPYAFTADSGFEIQPEPVSGRFLAVRLEGTEHFELRGIEYDIEVMSDY